MPSVLIVWLLSDKLNKLNKARARKNSSVICTSIGAWAKAFIDSAVYAGSLHFFRNLVGNDSFIQEVFIRARARDSFL